MRARPRILLVALALTALVFGMLSTAVLASPAGKGKATGATLFVSSGEIAASSAELVANGSLHVTGTGYAPNAGVTLVMTSPTAVGWFGGPADSDGNISVYNTVNSAGSYRLDAYQYVGNRQKATLMASITFEVSP